MKRPSVLYPTLVKGVIDGPIRCESLDGSEIYLPAGTQGIQFNGEQLFVTGTGRATLKNFRPFDVKGKTYCISHIQKKATYFSLLYDPFIYHFGKFWRLQEHSQNPDGGWSWKPGTERGIYWRTPGWRWQKPDAKSDWTPWIWSWGRAPGGHLD